MHNNLESLPLLVFVMEVELLTRSSRSFSLMKVVITIYLEKISIRTTLGEL